MQRSDADGRPSWSQWETQAIFVVVIQTTIQVFSLDLCNAASPPVIVGGALGDRGLWTVAAGCIN